MCAVLACLALLPDAAGCVDPQRARYTGPADGIDDVADVADARSDVVDEVVDGLGPDTSDAATPDDTVRPDAVEDDVSDVADPRDVGPADADVAVDIAIDDADTADEVVCDPPECGDRVCGTVENTCGETLDCGQCAPDDEVCSAAGQCDLECGDDVKTCACALTICQGVDPGAAQSWCASGQGTLCGPPIKGAYQLNGCAPDCGGPGKTMPGINLMCAGPGAPCVTQLNNSLQLELDCDACAPVCEPECPDIPDVCGDDGCGGSCGECQDGGECADQQCKAEEVCTDQDASCECMFATCLGMDLDEATTFCGEFGAADEPCVAWMLEAYAISGCSAQCSQAPPHMYPGMEFLCGAQECDGYKALDPDFDQSCEVCLEPQQCADAEDKCQCASDKCGDVGVSDDNTCKEVPEECLLVMAQALDDQGCGVTCDNGMPSPVLDAACTHPACDSLQLSQTECQCTPQPGACVQEGLSCQCILEECTGGFDLGDACPSMPEVCQDLIAERYEGQGGCGGECGDTQVPGLDKLCTTFDCVEWANDTGLGAICESCESPCLNVGGCSDDDYCVGGDCLPGEYTGEWEVWALNEVPEPVEFPSQVWLITATDDGAGYELTFLIPDDPSFDIPAIIVDKVMYADGFVPIIDNPIFTSVTLEIWAIFDPAEPDDGGITPALFTALVFADYSQPDGEITPVIWEVMGVR